MGTLKYAPMSRPSKELSKEVLIPGFAGYAPGKGDLFIFRLAPGQDESINRFGIMLVTEPGACDLFYINRRPCDSSWRRSKKLRSVTYELLTNTMDLRTAVHVARNGHTFDLDWLWVSSSRISLLPGRSDEELVKAWVGSVLDSSFSLCNVESWSRERRIGVCEWIWSSVTDFTIQGS